MELLKGLDGLDENSPGYLSFKRTSDLTLLNYEKELSVSKATDVYQIIEKFAESIRRVVLK